MLIWTGQGYLTFVILIDCSLLANFITNKITGSAQYWNHNPWILLYSMAVAGAIVFQIGHILYSKGTQIIIDKDTASRRKENRRTPFFSSKCITAA